MITYCDTIAEYFERWGALYQTIVALIFGIISVILWYQDRKKSKLIIELKNQTKLLQAQLNYLFEIDKPNLKVNFFKNEMSELYRISILNTGNDLFKLSFIPVSVESCFTMTNRTPFTSLGRGNGIEFEIKNNPGKKSEDFFELDYYDCFGNHMMQKLFISIPKYNAYFYPSTKL